MKNKKTGKILKYFLIFSVCFLSAFFILSIFRGGALSIARAEETKVGDAMGWVVGVLMQVAFNAASAIVGISGKALNWAFSFPTFKGVKAVDEVWYVLRDICNMFFIVILMVSAIATILRIDKYKFQDIIKYLLIAILAINFSKTITYVVVDFTQVLSRSFLSMAGAGLGPDASVGQVSEQLANNMGMTAIFRAPAFWDGVKFTGTYDMVKETLLASVVMMVAGVTFLVGAVMLIVRWVVILILIAVSAAAWGFYAIPDLRSYNKQWWSILLKYAFFAPVYAFFIGFALILVRMGGYTPPSGELASTGVTAFTRNPVYFINYIISIAVLWLGLNKAKSFGDKQANKIVAGAADRGQKFLKGFTMPRTRAALMAEREARKKTKEGLKQETAAKFAKQRLYGAKDYLQQAALKKTDAAREKLRQMPGVGGLISERGYIGQTLDKHSYKDIKDTEENKKRLEKLKELKDTPPTDMAEVISGNKKVSAGEKQAYAQYLADNTKFFSDKRKEALEQYEEAITSLDVKLRGDFEKKMKSSRIDLYVEYSVKSKNEKATDEDVKKALLEEVKGMNADKVLGQAGAVWGNKDFVDAVAADAKLVENIEKKGTGKQREAVLKSESGEKAKRKAGFV